MVSVDVVGIGPGDPDQVTVQAVKALRAAGAFLIVTKRSEMQPLPAAGWWREPNSPSRHGCVHCCRATTDRTDRRPTGDDRRSQR